MTLSDKKAALKAFRERQRKLNELDRSRYQASLPPKPEPVVKTTARERALKRNEQGE